MPSVDSSVKSAPQRILVIGGEATGKTTAARRLAKRSGAPLYLLDEIAWQSASDPEHELDGVFEPGYQAREALIQRPLEDRLRRVDEIAKGAAWVAEGVFLWWTDRLLARAELIIWLDHVGIATVARRVLARHARSAKREFETRPGMEKINRFGDYARAIRQLVGVLARVTRFHFAGAPLRPAPNDYGAITRRAIAAALAPHEERVLRVRDASELDVALDRDAPQPDSL